MRFFGHYTFLRLMAYDAHETQCPVDAVVYRDSAT